jgi:hypothetical protein
MQPVGLKHLEALEKMLFVRSKDAAWQGALEQAT